MKTPRLFVAVVCALAGTAYAGPDWIEVGDAGSSLATAQPIVGVGQPQRIEGSLSSGFAEQGVDLEDMYLLRIETPTSFSFDSTQTTFNTMLYLFNVTQAQEAFGLLANNDTPSSFGSIIDGPATDNTGAMVLNPGVYALAVTGFNRHPVSRTGDIFFFGSSTEISGPDGPGGINPLQGWTGAGETGSYTITLQGIGYVSVPAPGALAVLGAGVFMRRRRR
jgi:hypothetical protein